MDEQAAAIRRELDGRMLLADSLWKERKFPKFIIPDGKSQLEFNKLFIEELKSQVNILMVKLEAVPVSRNTGQNYSRALQNMSGLKTNPLALLDHKNENNDEE
jgi:hypothetical protein